MREVADLDHLAANLAGEFPQLLMRALQELVENAKFMHEVESGGMNGIATEIAQKIAVLFEHDHINTRACQQKAEHHPGRTAAGDAASRFHSRCLRFQPVSFSGRTCPAGIWDVHLWLPTLEIPPNLRPIFP